MSDSNNNNSLALEDEFERKIDTRFFQVDFLKALMIFLVIFDHIVSPYLRWQWGDTLWERISIPFFLVIMGFNSGISFQKKGDLTLKQLYSWSYFKGKIIRYILPFLVYYIASIFIGLFMYGFNFEAFWYGQYYPSLGIINLFTGFFLFWGPGNWFIPLLLQSIIILPLLYKAFTKKPIITLIATFIVEIIMILILFFVFGEVTSYEEGHLVTILRTSILIYLSAVGLGMWFSFGYKLTDKRNIFMWILFPISLAYIIAYQFFGLYIRINGIPLIRGDYHFLIFLYSAFIFLVIMYLLPQKVERKIGRSIKLISNSTYHILLTQMLGFGMVFAFSGTHYAIQIVFGLEEILELFIVWIIFISFGILWYKIDQIDNRIRSIFYYCNFFIVFASLFFFIFWIQAFWVPIPLLIIIAYAIIAPIIYFIIRKPINTKIIGLWTLFLLLTFTMMILQVVIFQNHEYWISLISISYVFILATIGTYLN
jgi:hypothetical protein